MTGTLTVANVEEHAIDERYYLATVAKVGAGNPVMGHASYLEHRTDAPSASLAPAIEGLVMRWSGLSLPVTVLLCDLLFPFLTVFILALGLRAFFGGSMLLGAAAAVFIGSDIGTYWLRAANPQIPFIGVAAWIALVFTLPLLSRKSLILRALVAGLLSWVHLVYASLFIIADGVLTLTEMIRQKKFKDVILSVVLYGSVLIVCFLPRMFFSLPPEVATDTFYRLGIIYTHAPAAPQMQMFLIGFLAVLWVLWRTNKTQFPESLRRSAVLLVASLVALNQSVIHGIDATFVSYYQPTIRILTLLTLMGIVWAVLRSARTRHAVLIGCSGIALVAMFFSVRTLKARTQAESDALMRSDVPQVLEWLRAQPGHIVVAAPNILNERIPAETPHYVLFNEYGWNQPMTDRELAERYALQVRLIPSSKARDATYTFIFGGHAGLQAAKERTLCKIFKGIGLTQNACVIEARSLIRHQELLPIVDNLQTDVAAALKTFHVTYVITTASDSGDIPAQCAEVKRIGGYAVRKCS